MKKTKIAACVLALAMLTGAFTGCFKKTSKVTAEDFESACGKLDLDEKDLDDIYSIEEDDIEDGIFMFIEEDDLDDDYKQDLDYIFKQIDLDDVIETDDIVSVSVAAKVTGYDSLYDIEEAGDIEDAELEGFYAIQITLTDDDKAEDFMDFVSDSLDMVDVDTDDMTSKEYYSSTSEGYVRFHLNIEDLAKLILENDDFQDLLDEADEDGEIEDMLGALSGEAMVTLEINGSDIVCVVGFGLNSDASSFSDFVKALGISDPSKLPMNDKIAEAIVDTMMSGVSQYVVRARQAAAMVEEHNAEVAAVEQEIDDALSGT